MCAAANRFPHVDVEGDGFALTELGAGVRFDLDADGAAERLAWTAAGSDDAWLDYKESKRVDEHGNRFRYRAKVDDAKGAKGNRWAWDVFLLRAP